MASDTGDVTDLMWTAGVTGNYFEVLGLRPTLGRFFGPEDDVKSAEPMVVLAHHQWQRLGSDLDILGRSVTLEG